MHCCTGRTNWFAQKGPQRRDSWATTVQVPESSLASHRKSSCTSQDIFCDDKVQIDRTGLRFLRSASSKGVSDQGHGWLEFASGLSEIERPPDDDCLSMASTNVGDDHSEAGSVLSLRSRRVGKKNGDERKGNKQKFELENIRKIAVIGKGNSGVVWRCVDKASRGSLALKQITLDDNEDKTKMAVRELVTMYGVDHEGVVTCHEVFYSRGSFQMVLEYMDGGSLLDAMRRSDNGKKKSSALSPGALAVVGRSIASALEMLHEVLEVIHRDVKPGNILLTSSGQVKLADLGICTPPGTVHVGAGGEVGDEEGPPATEWIGTVTYMSPERLLADPYSFKADVWSLGIVLAEAAVGRYPYALPDGGSRLEFWDLLDRVLSGPCPSKAVALGGAEWQGLAGVVEACLDQDPAQRPRASEVREMGGLGEGDSAELAGWVRRHLPSSKEGSEQPEVLRESDMWV